MLKRQPSGRWRGFSSHSPCPSIAPSAWSLILRLAPLISSISGGGPCLGPFHHHLPSHCQCKTFLGPSLRVPCTLPRAAGKGGKEGASWGPRPAPGIPCTSLGQSCGPSDTGARLPPRLGCVAVWPAGRGAGGGAVGRVWSGSQRASGRGTPCEAVGRPGKLRDPREALRLPPDRDRPLLPPGSHTDPRAVDHLTPLKIRVASPAPRVDLAQNWPLIVIE